MIPIGKAIETKPNPQVINVRGGFWLSIYSDTGEHSLAYFQDGSNKQFVFSFDSRKEVDIFLSGFEQARLMASKAVQSI